MSETQSINQSINQSIDESVELVVSFEATLAAPETLLVHVHREFLDADLNHHKMTSNVKSSRKIYKKLSYRRDNARCRSPRAVPGDSRSPIWCHSKARMRLSISDNTNLYHILHRFKVTEDYWSKLHISWNAR